MCVCVCVCLSVRPSVCVCLIVTCSQVRARALITIHEWYADDDTLCKCGDYAVSVGDCDVVGESKLLSDHVSPSRGADLRLCSSQPDISLCYAYTTTDTGLAHLRGMTDYALAFAGTRLYCLETEAHGCELLA